MQIKITKGKAYLTNTGLRCMKPRADNQELYCNKLIAKKNSMGELSGDFQCPDRRCRQNIQVEIIK